VAGAAADRVQLGPGRRRGKASSGAARRAAASAAPRSELPRLARQDLQGAPQPRWSKRNEPEPHNGPLPAPRRYVPRQRSVQRRTGGTQSSPARAAGHRFPALELRPSPSSIISPLSLASAREATRAPAALVRVCSLASRRPPPRPAPLAESPPLCESPPPRPPPLRSGLPRPGPSFRVIIVRRGYILSGREFLVLGLWGSVCNN